MDDTWRLEDEWKLEEEELPETLDSTLEPVIKICALCGGEVPGGGILRICTPCWNTLTNEPKVHLRLEGSDTANQGVVVWDHNSIGAEPHDKNPVAVGVWGKYGAEGTSLTYWVSLCKPIEAIHDMMTQFNAAIREQQSLFNAQIRYGATTIDNSGTGYKSTYTTKPRARVVKHAEVSQPEAPVSAADKLKNFLGR
jgi:hypothetical protein